MVPSQDRLSYLPDALIGQIFSFLPFEDAVRTSVLSKRWKHHWTSVPHLEFFEDNFDRRPWRRMMRPLVSSGVSEWDEFTKLNFVAMVDRCLLLHCSPIQSVRLRFNPVGGHASTIERWTHQLISKKQIRALDLDLCYGNSTAERTSRSFPLLWDAGSFSPSLRSLTLRNVSLSGDAIISLLRGFNCLERLCLECCSTVMLHDLVICGGSQQLQLESFRMVKCTGWKGLEIDAPNLRSLEYIDMVRPWRRVNLPSLSIAVLDFDECEDDEGSIEDVVKLLGDLTHVKSLSVSPAAFWALSNGESVQEALSNGFHNLKQLTLMAALFEEELAGFLVLLSNCHRLQMLTINDCSYCRLPQWDAWRKHDVHGCLVYHLKTVKVNSFAGSDGETLFVKFLLENAAVLEYLVIKIARWRLNEVDTLYIASKLLALPRSSISAKIMVS
ncbi:putative F-box/FBD/LRR-repeat protein [Nymphaea thermarum]|nr:putative F-box/FBD/LRR-repeat protein [Nymphaea thermarum]